MIELIALNKFYLKNNEQLNILTDINLLLPSVGFISITGKSGSGKSELLNMIGANDLPTSGQLIFNRISVFSSRAQVNKYRATEIGYIYQESFLEENKTIHENLKLAANLVRKKYLKVSWK